MRTLQPHKLFADEFVSAGDVLVSEPVDIEAFRHLALDTRVLGDLEVEFLAEVNHASEGEIKRGDDVDKWVEDPAYDLSYEPAAIDPDVGMQRFYEWTDETPAAESLVPDFATVEALPACTASGSGVGKTLTSTTLGVLLVVDGHNAVIDEVVLVKDQANPKDNGIYKVTDNGAVGGHNWILTRSTSYDASNEVESGMVFGPIADGTVNEGKSFILSGKPFSKEWTSCARRFRFTATVTAGTGGKVQSHLFAKE
jgi:hypothetical protein